MIKIRKARKEDLKAIYNLLKQLFAKERLSKKITFKLLKDKLKDKNTIDLVLTKERIIIGYGSIVFRQDIQSGGKIGYLSELILEQSNRGKGLGTKFLKEIMKECKKEKVKELQFPSTFKRKKARKFYESLGFNKTAYFFWKKIK